MYIFAPSPQIQTLGTSTCWAPALLELAAGGRCVAVAARNAVNATQRGEIGPATVLLIDRELGEVYGPEVLGEEEPCAAARPMECISKYCNERGPWLRTREPCSKRLHMLNHIWGLPFVQISDK